MTDKEAMKLALFALDIVKIHYTQSRHVNEAITALKERLADPMREVQRLGQEIEQEPVAWMSPSWIDPNTRGWQSDSFESIPIEGWLPLYTHPPQRTWVGLTDEEIQTTWDSVMDGAVFTRREVYKAIEAKLKENNT